MDYINIDQIAAASNTLKNTGFCRIDNILSDNCALKLTQTLKQLEYKHALTINGQAQELSLSQLQSMTPSERSHLFQQVNQQASQGVGFVYGRHFVTEQSPSVLKEIKAELNHTNVLQLISEISGEEIIQASAQATSYQRGHFLTRHNDIVPSEGRVYAYVISATEQWHPDWGGLLQFFEQDGSTTQSFSPKFNSMTIFDVSKIHSVTYVTPFALNDRLSITGWFRTK